MTTELILLVSLFAFLVIGAFLGENGPRKVFERSGPRLGAQIEKQITIGRKFRFADGGGQAWVVPNGAAPTGEL